jgi:hypothetical protein
MRFVIDVSAEKIGAIATYLATYVKVQNLLCEICHEAGCDSSKIEIAMKARGESVSTEAKHF